MVAGVVLEVGVVQLVARTDHQRGAQLQGPAPRSMLDVATRERPEPGRPLPGLDQGRWAERVRAGDPRCDAVLVEEDLEGDVLVLDERLRIALATRSDRGDIGAGVEDLLIPLADLTGPLSTGQSAEVAEEEHDPWRVRPPRSEALRPAVRVDELDICEGGEVEAHENSGTTSRANRSSPDVSYAASLK